MAVCAGCRDASTDDEMDTILLLTDTNCYIVNYDDDIDSLTHYQKIPLTDIYAIDIGKDKCCNVNLDLTKE